MTVLPGKVPDYLLYTADEAREVLQITDRRPAKIGMLATAERRAQQGQAGNDSGVGRGRGRGSKPPKPSRFGATGPAAAAPGGNAAGVQFADQQQQQQQRMPATLSYSDLAGGAGPSGLKTSQSVASFPGATSMASGLGEDGDGEEEVVGGAGSAFEDIEEEVVDDQNIDEEFEKVLEQEDGRGRSITPGSTGKQQQQQMTPGSINKPSQPGGGTPQEVKTLPAGYRLEGGALPVGGAAGGAAGAGHGSAGDRHQQYQYWHHDQHPPPDVHNLSAAGGAAGGVPIETAQQQPPQHDATAAAQRSAAGPEPVTSEPGWPGGLDVQGDWEDVQKQHQQVSGTKRAWAQLGTAGGSVSAGGSAAVSGAAGPSLSGPGTSTSAGAAPSSSQGGFKRIKLKLGGGAQKSEQQ